MQPDGQLAQIILYGAGVVLLALFGWIVKTVRDLTTEMAAWRVALFGMSGGNGLTGEVRDLQTSVAAIQERNARMDPLAASYQRDLERREEGRRE